MKLAVCCGDREHRVELEELTLPVSGGPDLKHYEVDVGAANAPVLVVGHALLDRHLDQCVARGLLRREQADEVRTIVALADFLPERGRRLQRQVLSRRLRSADPTKLSAEADRRAGRKAKQLEAVCRAHRDGRLQGLGDLSAGQLLSLLVGNETAALLRELEAGWLLTPDERATRRRARAVLADRAASDQERKRAQGEVEGIEAELDARYGGYYELRRELFGGGLTAAEVAREIDNLRKSKTTPYGKAAARLLVTEAEDMAVYWPYAAAMACLRRGLKRQGRLTDPASRGLYDFMHSPRPLLSGIVPALHPIGDLLLQSVAFRRAVATYAAEDLDGQGGKSPTTICALYGAVIAVAEVYAEKVHQLRAKDEVGAGKVKHRGGR